MLRNDTPSWVYVGAFALTTAAGVVNAVGVLDVHHRGLTHLTGLVSVAAVELTTRHDALGLSAVMVVGAFFLGAVLAGALIRDARVHHTKRYALALLGVSALLGAALMARLSGRLWAELLIAMAAGLQNALATSFSSAVVRTTHMTGIVTDLGINLGNMLVDRRRLEVPKLKLHLVLLGGFFTGSCLGALVYAAAGPLALLGPIGITGVGGALYWRLGWYRGRDG